MATNKQSDSRERGSVWEVLRVFLRLGVTSFGGPVAHLGYFREEFVVRKKWLHEKAYADLVALCQFLPGPASSQVGIAIGLSRAGMPGAVAAWLGFTLPSAAALVAFGYSIAAFGDAINQGWLHGLKIVAVAVVAQAVWGMARSLCPDPPRLTIAGIAAACVLAWSTPLSQVAVILLGGVAGWLILKADGDGDHAEIRSGLGRTAGLIALVAFFAILIALPILAKAVPNQTLALVDSFYRAGSLVFGGGHVVLPLLQSETVPPGWVSRDAFLAGYGAAQAVPGPLFTFAAYLGTVMGPAPNGWLGGLICLLAIFAPSFLLVIGALPFWDAIRRIGTMQLALRGINAAVVGLLLAALYDPVWTSAIGSRSDFMLALLALLLLQVWRVPPWLVVVLCAAGGAGLEMIAR